MKPIQMYEELIKLKEQSPELIEKRIEEMWDEFFNSLKPDERERAKQFKWQIDGQLRGIKNPTARLNKMIDIFWQGVQNFQMSLTNPRALIAQSQDGSKAVVLPIKKDTRNT